jgi:uncharacterized membrane protein YdjX (TVP38/TMEM64 family)
VRLAKLGLALLALAALIVAGRTAAAHFAAFAGWVQAQGVLGPAIFVAGYAAAVVAFVPASILTLAAGAIFGVVEGTLYVLAAATLGSALAFLVSRYVARAAVEQRLSGNPKLAAIDRAIGAEGRKIVLLLRLSPAFPFSALNYALGLTRVRFVDYLIASVGMLPGTLLYVYSGKLAGDVALLAGGASSPKGPGYHALLGLGLIATLLVTLSITRIARRARTGHRRGGRVLRPPRRALLQARVRRGWRCAASRIDSGAWGRRPVGDAHVALAVPRDRCDREAGARTRGHGERAPDRGAARAPRARRRETPRELRLRAGAGCQRRPRDRRVRNRRDGAHRPLARLALGRRGGVGGADREDAVARAGGYRQLRRHA